MRPALMNAKLLKSKIHPWILMPECHLMLFFYMSNEQPSSDQTHSYYYYSYWLNERLIFSVWYFVNNKIATLTTTLLYGIEFMNDKLILFLLIAVKIRIAYSVNVVMSNDAWHLPKVCMAKTNCNLSIVCTTKTSFI